MNKNTMFYGLLVAGGLLVYFSWKKNKASEEKTLSNSTSTSGTFVDDVSVLSETEGLKPLEPKLIENIKGSVSSIVEPFIAEDKNIDLSGQLI